MAIAIKNTLRNYRLRIVNGPVGQFFRWWGEELREAMPAQFRARLQYARRKLLIQVEREEVIRKPPGQGTSTEKDGMQMRRYP